MSRRDVEPYRLVNWGRRWYLVAWDTQRADWRTYRVDRVEPRTPTGPRFAARPLPDEDLARYVSRGVGAAAWRYQAQVTVHAPADVIAERLPVAVGPVVAIDERTCRLQTGSDNPEMLAAWLGMLGVDFDIDNAPELATALRTIGERYLRAAGDE
jgi:predicted DNA-binding transcriptional regulator YafY